MLAFQVAPIEVRFTDEFLGTGQEMFAVFAGFVAFAALLALDLFTAPRQAGKQ